jgi:hypothetical protein
MDEIVRHSKQLTVWEKLLIAAYELEREKNGELFSAEDLVVAAWKKFPDSFGLLGYKDEDGRLKYPDSNRVFAEIMGSKPIRKYGFLVKVGSKMYKLTEAGREQAKMLLNKKTDTQLEKAGLARETYQELKRLLSSRAVQKYKNGQTTEITFYDACMFWRISPSSSAIEFEGRVSAFEKILEYARASHKEGVLLDHEGRKYTLKDLDMLDQLNKTLLARFKDEINIIKRRRDERQ